MENIALVLMFFFTSWMVWMGFNISFKKQEETNIHLGFIREQQDETNENLSAISKQIDTLIKVQTDLLDLLRMEDVATEIERNTDPH
ncbi:hypothetical protein IC229_05715 [Spirosoma sp. BT702]|uniref:Uncharacterized protein n=1 Tax=Spirosoma profusum TaxID=2771354 RepID=A0A927ATG1_9BACT|nr:hypothetical protein [Spirosoma profusum]MBD2700122.1 hypothetical protein [Spirosoma profusum]